MNRPPLLAAAAFFAAAPATALAAGAQTGGRGVAIGFFLAVIALTLAITYWAARRNRTADEFYRAGGRITGFQNGLAIAGDFMSAATLLGITGLIYMSGFDTVIYVLSPLVGMCILVFLVAEPFRNLGRFTVTDVAAYRLQERPIRIFSAFASLVVVLLYLVAQLVGAGALIQILFGLPYGFAVLLIGLLMTLYVAIGGMTATSWVQISKAAILVAAVTILAFLVLLRFDFNLVNMYDAVASAHRLGVGVFQPGGLLKDPVSTMSLGLALVFGFVGLPHVLMRLYTVSDAHEARRSVVYAAGFYSYVSGLIFFVVGYGAIVLLAGRLDYFDAEGGLIGGSNMVAVHLAHEVGGEAFLGFISAVAFATILAVVSGLTIAGASAISHDLYAGAVRHGEASEKEELRASKIATVGLSFVAIALAVAFEKQNIAFMASLVFAVSASASFPLLILALYWRGLTTRGAVIGGVVGLASAVGLIILGPAIWVQILGNESPVFPYSYPGLFSIPAGFLAMIVFSFADKSEAGRAERARYDSQIVESLKDQSIGR
ncbi:MAG: sodium/solute symporter [Parvularculaceae bacterium]